MSFVTIAFRADSEQVRWLIASTLEPTHHVVDVGIAAMQRLTAQLAGETVAVQDARSYLSPSASASM